MPTRRRSDDSQDLIAGISRQIKRPRHEDDDVDIDQSQDDNSSDNVVESQESQDETPLPVDENDGYVEGSIVKITLRNFVTYDYCELTPGPQLNMIIGPNGTGKSTVVCAIALGLGGAPSLLGRAKNIAEFVKTGEDEAVIQIELKRTGGKRNVVIQRKIQKTSNSTSWLLNGRSAPQKDVLKIISELNIQVDNLCQFLPQDKVAEFAQLTPALLLERTQVAAGAKDLSECHQKLIELRNEEKSLIATHESDKSHFKTVNDRAKNLQKDVEKLKTREEILKRVKLLKAKLPLAKYTDAKAEYDEAKEVEREKKQTIEKLEEQLAPIQATLKNYDEEVKQHLNSRQAIERRVQELNQNLQMIDMRIERSRNDTKSVEAEIARVKQRHEKRKQELRSLEERVESFRRKVREQPPLEDTSQIDAEIAQIESQLEDLENEKASAYSEYKKAEEVLHGVKQELEAKQDELKGFNDIVRRRMHNLSRQHEDTYKAYQWLMQNRDKFRGKIHGPILLQLQLKDRRYADIVESVLGGERGSHLRTFVCEYKEDYELFTKETVDKLRLKLTVSWPDKIDENAVRPMMPESELREKFGLEYFVSELLEGPKIVIDYLCLQTKINLVPVSLKLCDEERIAERSPFRRYAMQDSIYEVRRYNYGGGGHQTSVRKIGPAKLMNDSLDGEQYNKVKSELEVLKSKYGERRDRVKAIIAKREQITRRERELENDMRAKKEEKKNIQLKLLEWKKGKLALERMEEELERARAQPDTVEQEIEDLKQQISSHALHRASFIHKYKDTLKDLANTVIERNVIRMKHTQAVAKHDFVSRLTSHKTRLLSEAKHGWERAHRSLENKKAVAKELQVKAMQVAREIPADIAEEFRMVMDQWKADGCLDQSASDIEQSINEESAKAEAIRSTNPRALEQYEKYMAEVRQLEQKMENEARKLERLQRDMQATRNRWEPKLKGLVEKISQKFSESLQKIGCAGEVCVAPHEDYDNWGIEIRVKFRDNEKLQLLTGQRQSGGERAVSTILYLMALQNVAKSPFRVVDEINQGMDPRNERMIHEQIVKGASRPGTAQYFLITPKLLPDLYYNERMRVLCIYNGEWQPKKLKPWSHYIQNYRATVA